MDPDLIRKFFRGPSRRGKALEWRWYPKGKYRHDLHYRIVFDPAKREFWATTFNRKSRSRGQQSQALLSPEATAVLRSLLPAEAVAICTAASIHHRPNAMSGFAAIAALPVNVGVEIEQFNAAIARARRELDRMTNINHLLKG